MDKAKTAVQWIAQLVSTILISGRSRPSDKGGGGGLKKNFQPSGPQFGLAIRGEAGFPGPLPLDPPLLICCMVIYPVNSAIQLLPNN